MSEPAFPAGGTPPDPDWTWWNGLTLADPQRQPQQPSLIAADGMHELPTLEALAEILAAQLAGRPAVLKRSVASYPGFDTFPAFSVYARAEAAEAATAAVYVGCVAVQKTKAEALEAAIAAAQAGAPRKAA